MPTVDEFRKNLDPATLASVDLLRSLIISVHPGLTEQIKWNAPSFALAGNDRITLGLQRDGSIRVVLHQGAKPKALRDFRFDDPARLAKWPAPDRGVIIFENPAHVERHREEFRNLCRRWLEETV